MLQPKNINLGQFLKMATLRTKILTLEAPAPPTGQSHSNKSLEIADELFECLTILWGWRLKG